MFTTFSSVTTPEKLKEFCFMLNNERDLRQNDEERCNSNFYPLIINSVDDTKLYDAKIALLDMGAIMDKDCLFCLNIHDKKMYCLNLCVGNPEWKVYDYNPDTNKAKLKTKSVVSDTFRSSLKYDTDCTPIVEVVIDARHYLDAGKTTQGIVDTIKADYRFCSNCTIRVLAFNRPGGTEIARIEVGDLLHFTKVDIVCELDEVRKNAAFKPMVTVSK